MFRTKNIKLVADGANPKTDLSDEQRKEELSLLNDMVCFDGLTDMEAYEQKLYATKFLDLVKPDGTKQSRLCVATCNDQKHGFFTDAPTISHISLRLPLAVVVTFELTLHVGNVTKAFVVRKTFLCRLVYMKAPNEIKLGKGKGFHGVRPTYETPVAPRHLFETYTDYHRRTLMMTPKTLGACLMFRRGKRTLEGFVGSQVDDTAWAATLMFEKEETITSEEFPNTGKGVNGNSITQFNGRELQKQTRRAVVMTK